MNLPALPLTRGVAPIRPGSEIAGSEPFEGQYLLAGEQAALARADADCPYCAGPLGATHDGGIVKVIQLGAVLGPKREIFVLPLPETHELLWCMDCLLGFTRPRG